MERKHKFLILITAYNDEKWVEYNLASIINQTYNNYRVVYFDDASKDNTYQKALSITKGKNKFQVHTREKNKGTMYTMEMCIKEIIKEDEILLCLSGDDWLFDDNVLEKLNQYYNENDVWMTYGKFVCWNENGDPVTEASPQNTPHPDFIHEHKYYRKDIWRASHLRTFKGSLLKKFNVDELKSKIDNTYFDHASDLAMSFPCMEMCGKDRIGVIDFYTYVYNTSPSNSERTKERENNTDNYKYESEIRNRRIYKTLKDITDKPKKLPQINVIGYFQETNYIPKNLNIVYGLEEGEFDTTLITDMDLHPYLKGEKKFPKGKVVADLHETPTYNKILEEVYNLVYENHTKFDLILTYDSKLLTLPNAQLRFPMWRCLNKNLHKREWPLLADNSLYKLYEKSKNLSCISSNKAFLEGHRKRLEFVKHILEGEYKNNIDMYGVGFNEIAGKIEGLKDYRFSIAIENEIKTNWITEKLSDCFLTGVIPIYYGCPNVGDFFDLNGILTFSTKEELDSIIKDITLNGEEIYQSKLKSVKNNFKIVDKYSINMDQLYDKYLKNL